jgi:hypothetical protein
MKRLLSVLKISVPDKIFIKDPETSELGRRIIEQSIILISSIYRYFESKHKLLLYLSSWYWAWLEYQLVIETFSISNHLEKLEKAVTIVTRTVVEDNNFAHIDETLLYKIIVNESSKSFLTKEVDKENEEGYFEVYKRVITRISEMILNVKKEYSFSLSLASTIIEGGLYQHYLRKHFPSITNCNDDEVPSNFFIDLVNNTLKKV